MRNHASGGARDNIGHHRAGPEQADCEQDIHPGAELRGEAGLVIGQQATAPA
jgi:hypothetical protein